DLLKKYGETPTRMQAYAGLESMTWPYKEDGTILPEEEALACSAPASVIESNVNLQGEELEAAISEAMKGFVSNCAYVVYFDGVPLEGTNALQQYTIYVSANKRQIALDEAARARVVAQ